MKPLENILMVLTFMLMSSVRQTQTPPCVTVSMGFADNVHGRSFQFSTHEKRQRKTKPREISEQKRDGVARN